MSLGSRSGAPSRAPRPSGHGAPLGELDRLDADGQAIAVHAPRTSAYAGRQRWTRRWERAILVTADVLQLLLAIALAYLAR